MTKAKNQIRILCDNCGCYYFWDIEFEHENYNKAVYQTPEDAKKYCPECGGQKVAAHAHHSADTFNCEMGYTQKFPRYFLGPGSSAEPILAMEKLSLTKKIHPAKKPKNYAQAVEHKECHRLLHEYLDELIVDMRKHRGDKLLSKMTVLELWNWSHEQTIIPSEKD